MAGNLISLPDPGAALVGLSALSTAAFGLLDSTKAFWGGPSNIGCGHIRTALTPFSAALDNALGPDGWWPVLRANWVTGVAKADQKAKAQALIKLGLNTANAPQIATATHVNPPALQAAVKKLETGAKLSDADLNVLGRMNATLDALLDAAFETADQQYRNACRVLAGLIALPLAFAAWWLWPTATGGAPPSLWAVLAVGLLAVPVAPVAKDLTSALSAAMNALKAAKRL
ncbi:MAG TPA: hypothetical protein VIE16_05580 [Phenylobacterium sp.]|jgi:hypothetical protein